MSSYLPLREAPGELRQATARHPLGTTQHITHRLSTDFAQADWTDANKRENPRLCKAYLSFNWIIKQNQEADQLNIHWSENDKTQERADVKFRIDRTLNEHLGQYQASAAAPAPRRAPLRHPAIKFSQLIYHVEILTVKLPSLALPPPWLERR